MNRRQESSRRGGAAGIRHRTGGGIARRTLLGLALAAGLFTATAAPALADTAHARPAAAAANTPHSTAQGIVKPAISPWQVTLTSSVANPWVTQYTTITATANLPIFAPYKILIYETSFDSTVLVQSCLSSPCSVDETSNYDSFGYDFVAFIAPFSTTAPPPNILAQSSDLYLTWRSASASLSATANTLPVGSSTTLTANSDVDISTSPFSLRLWDTTTAPPALKNTCKTGPCPPFTVSQPSGTTRAYQATIASSGAANPPANLQSTSPTTYITWNNLGWRISLSAASGSPWVTATANNDVGPTAYYIDIYDETTGTRVATCGTGLTCTAYVKSSGNLVAFVAGYSTTPMPSGIVASSNTVTTDYNLIS